MADPRGDLEQSKPFGGEVWTVEVGESKQRWKVHRDLLCNHSTFFQSAVKEKWSDDGSRTILLPEDSVDVFQVYVQWLYQNEILVQKRSEPRDNAWQPATLLKCYAFGEKIQDVVFQDTVIDGIFAYVHEKDQDGKFWYLIDADTVYGGTPEGSPLRQLIVDMFVYHGHQDWIRSQRNVDFFMDLTKKLLELRAKPSDSPVSKLTSFTYHKIVPNALTDPRNPKKRRLDISQG